MIRIIPHVHRPFPTTPLSEFVAVKPVAENIADDEDVHLQQAHDTLRSRIAKARREKKDVSHLEKRLASIAGLLKKEKA